MANQYVNKVVLSNGTTLIDLTADSAIASKVLYNYTFHDKSGAPQTGSCTFDADTSDATASASEILSTKTAYVNGVKLTGSMPNNGGTGGTITDVSQGYTIPLGFSDGSANVNLDATSLANLIPQNVRQGVEIAGVEGTMSGSEDVSAQSKSATPSWSQQTITPDAPTYNYLTQVTVAPIPITYADNAQGGQTVTIGAAS